MNPKILFFLFLPFYLSSQVNWEPTWGPTFGQSDYYHQSGNFLFAISSKMPYRSTDGEHWQLLNNIPANLSVNYLTSCGNRLFIIGYKELLYSDDQGNNWKQDTLSGIVSSYSRGNELFFANGHHLYYSPDQGTSWQYIRAHDFIIGMTYFQNQFYLVDNKGQLFRSADKGKTLQQITNPGQSSIFSVYGIGPIKENMLLNDNDMHLYSIAGVGLHRMDSQGAWTDLSAGLGSSITWFYNVRVDSNNIYLAGTGNTCYLSNKTSIAWSPVKTPYYVYDMMPFKNKLMTSGTHGIKYSLDKGLTWEKAYHHIYTGTWGVLMESEANELWSWGSKSNDYGTTWNAYPYGDTLSCLKKRNTVIIAHHLTTHKKYISINSGVSWSIFSTPSATTGSTFNIHKQVIFVGGSYAGTYRSGDLGKTWQPVHQSDFISFVDLDSLLFASTYNNLYASRDGGQSWQLKNFGLTNIKEPVWIINAGGALYCQTITSPKFRSADQGKTWTQLTEKGLNVTRRTCIAASTDRVFVSGYDYGIHGSEIRHGIYELVLGDTAWHFLDQYVTTDDLLVHGNYLFAAFGIKGIERLRLAPDAVISVAELTDDTDFVTYPNPCGDQLMIRCKRPLSGPLNLYDLHGRLIYSQEIVNESTSASINTTALPAGFYFLRLPDRPAVKVSIVHN